MTKDSPSTRQGVDPMNKANPDALLELAEPERLGRERLVDRLCDLHRRVLARWQSPTGVAPPRRAKWMKPRFDDAETIIFATIELEQQAHDLKELHGAITFIQPALPVLKNLLGTIGLRLGEAKAEEMIAALDAMSAIRARAQQVKQ